MAKTYTVIAQRQSTTIDAAGGQRDVVVVTFKTPSDAVGSVRVPLEEYDAATVDKLVSERAAHMEAVAAL